MNKSELKEKLDLLGINENLYSLSGALLPDRVILYNSYDEWLVFYFDERGNRNDEQTSVRKTRLVNIFIISSKGWETFNG
jgi:hypothetical protein